MFNCRKKCFIMFDWKDQGHLLLRSVLLAAGGWKCAKRGRQSFEQLSCDKEQKRRQENTSKTVWNFCRKLKNYVLPIILGTTEQSFVRRRKGERSQSCVMLLVKHPHAIHTWHCFSSKGVGLLSNPSKNTDMNKKLFQNVPWEQLLSTEAQFGLNLHIFQHTIPCHFI